MSIVNDQFFKKIKKSIEKNLNILYENVLCTILVCWWYC